MRAVAPLVLALFLALPHAARGQTAREASAVPVAGDWSLSASLFTSDTGSVFGVGRMITDRLAIGLELDLRDSTSDETLRSNVTTSGTATSTDHTFGPTFRWYGARDTPVSPYLRGKFAVGWNDNELVIQGDQQQYQDIFTIQGSLSLGAEWYPLRYLSVGGHAGLQWVRDTVDSAANSIVRERTTTSWGTFRSGLELNFYFR